MNPNKSGSKFLCPCDECQGALCFTPVHLLVCLSITLIKSLYNQRLLQFLSIWSKTLHKCFRHIEDVHLPFWRENFFCIHVIPPWSSWILQEMSHKILLKYIAFYQNFEGNLPEMNEEYSFIFYTFFKNLQEMKEKPPWCLFEIFTYVFDTITAFLDFEVLQFLVNTLYIESVYNQLLLYFLSATSNKWLRHIEDCTSLFEDRKIILTKLQQFWTLKFYSFWLKHYEKFV